ncbi:MAG: hypothetical protein ABR540_00210 [Acidimicrobiales bacterium]
MTTVEATPAARRARHFRWLERRLFEILGGWVPSEPDPEIKLVLRSHSFQHAWHADLWGGLLPPGGDGPFPDPDPGPSSGLTHVLREMAQPAGSLERLTGAYRVVLPGLVEAYETCRDEITPAAGGPALRALGLILADEVEACRVGEQLVQRLLDGTDSAGQEPDHRGLLEGLLRASGGMKPHVIS